MRVEGIDTERLVQVEYRATGQFWGGYLPKPTSSLHKKITQERPLWTF